MIARDHTTIARRITLRVRVVAPARPELKLLEVAGFELMPPFQPCATLRGSGPSVCWTVESTSVDMLGKGLLEPHGLSL